LGETYPGEELVGGDASINAQITKDVLAGKDGACRKVVLLNAALAIMAGEKAENIREGIAIAEECIDNGAAIKKLQALIELTNS
jgi:anthranilate phosphoribosyltransferase